MSEFKLRQEQLVAERLGQMPKSYRATYRKAVAGNSLRAAVNSFCLECVGWRMEEIRHCTDLGCPLYAVRPYQRIPQNAHDERFGSVESMQGSESGSYVANLKKAV